LGSRVQRSAREKIRLILVVITNNAQKIFFCARSITVLVVKRAMAISNENKSGRVRRNWFTNKIKEVRM